MSTDVKLSMAKIGLILTVLGSLLAILSYVVPLAGLPNRMTAAETSIKTIQSERQVDRELLVRIDENVKALKEAQGKRP